MTVYIDIVIIENLIMNFLIIYTSALISKTKPVLLRIFVASLIGAIYAIIIYCTKLKIYSNVIFKIILSIVIVYIAFNPPTMKKMWKEVLIFYLVSLLFGGTALYLIYFLKPENVEFKNGVFYGTYAFKNVILSGIVGFIILTIYNKIIRYKINKKNSICKIKIIFNEKEVTTNAMIDTGNFLKDPITNLPVVIVEHTLLYEVFPKEILNNLNNILGGDLKEISNDNQSKYLSKLKVIPFSSLGKENGMLLGIKANKIVVENDEEVKEHKEIIVGIYNKSLTKKGEYRALIGMELL